uniref:Uncharacterized protein n=1 Tax=Cucumis melo TaxID=3656 RepID=A0A9I9CPH4_CUCME
MAPARERRAEAATCLQNLPNISHTLFHRTCEFPSYAITPMAMAAPAPEESSATDTVSRTMTSKVNTLLLPFLLLNVSISDNNPYKLAITFVAKKYLQTKENTCD